MRKKFDQVFFFFFRSFMFTLSSLSQREFHIASIHHSTWWCKKDLLSFLSCVKHFLSFLSIKCGVQLRDNNIKSHTMFGNNELSFMAFAHQNNKQPRLGYYVFAYFRSPFFPNLWLFFCRHFDLPSFSIFLRARQKKNEKKSNWIFPKHHWRLLLTAPNFCLIWFRSSQSLIVISTQSSRFIYFQCAIRQVFVFHLTRFNIISSHFCVGWCGK